MATACITGASSGIGLEIARILGSYGYDLVLIARDSAKLQRIAKQITKKCHNQIRCSVIPCDLASQEACQKLAQRLRELPITILVNNAGFGELNTFTDGSLKHQMDMINVNIKAVHILTHELLPHMIKQDHGYILNVASSAGLMPGSPYMSVYYATKSYVTSLTAAISRELSIAGSHVHVSMLCPGPVNTGFNDAAGVSHALPGISARRCAAYAVKKMFQGKVTIVPTLTIQAAVTFTRFLPRSLAVAIAGHQQKKKIQGSK